MNERQEVLIFGGGLIGGAAATALSNLRVPVRVITRVPSPANLNGIKWQFGTISNPREEKFFNDCRAVIYAGGSMTPGSSISSIAQVLAEQVVPVVMLAEEAARAGVSNFIFISSGGTVYGRTTSIPTNENVCTAPVNAYGMVKVQTEQALLEVARQSAMNVIILRVSNPYGPAQQGTRSIGFVAAVIEASQRNTPVNIWGDGLNERDFVYLDDVAEAIRLSIDWHHDSTILNIGSGKSTSLLEICNLISTLINKKINIVFDQSRDIDVRVNALDVKKAQSVLQWNAKISLEVGIQKILKLKDMIST